MPYVEINTNVITSIEKKTQISQQLSCLTAGSLKKSEQYVMVCFKPVEVLLFGGNNQPAALLIVKSLGLDKSQINQLSDELSHIINKLLNVNKDRIYINFEAPPRTHWAYNGKTFA